MAEDRASGEPDTFSREYVAELRAENKGWRLKADEMTKAAQAAREAADKVGAEAEARVTAAREQVVRAELRAAAVRAGMIDLDGLKLADLSGVALNDDGEVEGAEAVLAQLKDAKPYLFTPAGQGTSSTQTPPPPKPTTSKSALAMSQTEWAEAQRRIERGLGVLR
jgi:hypothetical protein